MDQRDATAWVWNQIWDAGSAQQLSEPPTDPEAWSEFEVTTSDGTRITVRVEV